MVSPLQSLVAGSRAQPLPSMGNMIRQQALTDAQLKTQSLQQQQLEQGMAQQQQAGQAKDALSSAQYLNRLGKKLLSVDEAQWPQILSSELPQISQNIPGFRPDMLRGLTRDQVASVVAQTDPLFAQGGPEKGVVLGEGERLVGSISGRTIAEGGEKSEKIQPKVDKLRSRYDNFTKDLRQVDAAFRKVNSAPETAAGDMSLIFGYMKLLDPGSTVREGEFATAQDATGVPERVINLYNRALTGERLNAEQRQDFKLTAKSAFDAQQDSADVQIANLLQQADQDNVPREKVLGEKALREFEKRAADRLIAQSKQEEAQEEEKPATITPEEANRGGQVMVDASGNRAVVFPDGTFRELK